MLDPARVTRLVDEIWSDSVVATLEEYIRIPNKSPMFDPDWQRHGHMERAVELFTAWCRDHALPGMRVDTVRLSGRTPLIFIDIPGIGDGSILLYGHLDKQPEMSGWRDGLDPWRPVREDDRLYGRGGADDGYAMFAALSAAHAVIEQGLPHAGLRILIEASEESGSPDLPAYMEHLGDRIGDPDLVICLDSGCGNYDQLWCTTSLRGLVGGTLTVDVLTEGVHSGDAGGIVPSSFRIARLLLDRLEDAASGRILPPALHVDIPPGRIEQAGHAAEVLGDQVYAKFPFHGDTGPAVDDRVEQILARTWRPSLEITGAGGLPEPGNAGNVLRPRTQLKLSLRLPPTCDSGVARHVLADLLVGDPPHGASVRFEVQQAGDGWQAPAMPAWLEQSIDDASKTFFSKPSVQMGEGGTIPFMAMLGRALPRASFLITGVLGPHSNAHGPNEFLHLPTARRVSACVAQVIADHQRARGTP
jgi:acetylornithine deacetylase/succinyl-diaminopimelate desuccinylase-like protein